MKKIFLSKEGVLTESFREVILAEDGFICNDHNEAKAYETIGKVPMFVKEIEFAGYKWQYPSLNGYDMEVVYSQESGSNDFSLCFEVRKEGLFLKEIFYWDRCRELDEYVDIGNMKGISIEEFITLKNTDKVFDLEIGCVLSL